MNKKQQTINYTKGFTIIEVVLVLAIAGLIFLMVFIALPNLQRGQRDSQRKSDLARIQTQINNYSSSNRGKIPVISPESNLGTFVLNYLWTSSDGSRYNAGPEYKDPSGKGSTTVNNGYTIKEYTGPPSTLGIIYYKDNALCGDDGAVDGPNPSPRNYVLVTKLESQNAPYCLDNR